MIGQRRESPNHLDSSLGQVWGAPHKFGDDADNMACIAGAAAEAYHGGVPSESKRDSAPEKPSLYQIGTATRLPQGRRSAETKPVQDEWYYAEAGIEHGPVTLADLVHLAASTPHRLADLAWRKDQGNGPGLSKFVIANLVEGQLQPEGERLVSVTAQGIVRGAGISTGLWHDSCEAQQESHYWSLLSFMTQETLAQSDDPDRWFFLSACYFDLGGLYQRADRIRQAEWAFDHALAIRERLVQSQPDHRDYQQAIAASCNQRGLLSLDIGDFGQAALWIGRAVSIREQLLEAVPSDASVAVGLGGALCNLGLVLCEQGRPAESLGRFERAIQLLESQLPNLTPQGLSVVWSWLFPGKYAHLTLLRRTAQDYLSNARSGHARATAQRNALNA